MFQPAGVATRPLWAGEPVHEEQHRDDRDGRELERCGKWNPQWGHLTQGWKDHLVLEKIKKTQTIAGTSC